MNLKRYRGIKASGPVFSHAHGKPVESHRRKDVTSINLVAPGQRDGAAAAAEGPQRHFRQGNLISGSHRPGARDLVAACRMSDESEEVTHRRRLPPCVWNGAPVRHFRMSALLSSRSRHDRRCGFASYRAAALRARCSLCGLER